MPRRKRRRGRRPAVTAPSRPAPGADAIGTLQSILRELRAERDRIDRQLAAVEKAFAEMNGAPAAPAARRGVGRPRGSVSAGYRPGSLKDHVHSALAAARGPVSVQEIHDAVLKAGFETENKTLAKSIGIALAQMPTAKRVGRGRYQAA